MKIALVTFGCRLNRAEALDLEASLAAAGHEIITLPQGAAPIPSRSDPLQLGSDPIPSRSHPLPDLIIVRGCSVTAKAQRDCEKAIARLRKRFPHSQISITGCLANASPLSILQGPVPLPPKGLDHKEVGSEAGSDHVMKWGQTPVPTSTSRAYLKIQDGCSGKCSFCVVPHFRGPSISIPSANVIARAQAFISADYHEIVVTGCNLSLYHSNGVGLPEIILSLANLSKPGSDPMLKCRIRLGSLEPGMLDSGILDVLEAHPNVCRFLHLSIQSGSDRILSAMNRPYRIVEVSRFVMDVRRRLGQRIMLGADIITGFPGETEEDFISTRRFLAEGDFANVHVFPFSERPDTTAAAMEGSVPVETRRIRARIIAEDAAIRRRRFAESFIGQEVDVCVERGGDHGWTDEYLQARLDSPQPRRSLVRAAVTAVEGDILIASAYH